MNMKRKVFGFAAAALLAGALAPAGSARAAAYDATWQVSVTYQNVSANETPVTFTFFAENSATPIAFTPVNADGSSMLKPGASTSLAVGSVSGMGAGFKGSGVLSANEPVVATIVQISNGITNRPLSNGFNAEDGASRQLVASVLKNEFSHTTSMSVQNVESGPIDVTVQFFAVGATTPTYTATATNLPANAAKYFDAGKINELGARFNGSAVVTAKMAGSATDAKTVVTVNELGTTSNSSKSFEGTPDSSAKVYMASALCKFASAQYTHSYAIQSTGGTATFNIVYKRAGQADIAQGPFTLNDGQKQSVQGCDVLPAGSNGSAVIERISGTGTLVALGKINGGGVTSAFLGTSTGAAKLALPYVRWSNDANYNSGKRQRAFIAIQNIGGAAATNVRVQYIDRNGTVLGTHSLGTVNPGAKANSNPSLVPGVLDACQRFGEYGGGADCLGTSFGAGAYVLADGGAQLTAVVRIQGGIGALGSGEDYNGMEVAP